MGTRTHIRPAAAADLAAVERLALDAAPDALGPALRGHPMKTQVEVLVALRSARAEPAAGVFVATDGSTFVGFVRYTTADMPTPPLARRLRALRPLGIAGALRFIVVALLAFERYRPERGEVYLAGLAVVPPYRGRGVARRLVEHLEASTRDEGFHSWAGVVDASNSASRNLFASLGYAETPLAPAAWRRTLLREPSAVLIRKHA